MPLKFITIFLTILFLGPNTTLAQNTSNIGDRGILTVNFENKSETTSAPGVVSEFIKKQKLGEKEWPQSTKVITSASNISEATSAFILQNGKKYFGSISAYDEELDIAEIIFPDLVLPVATQRILLPRDLRLNKTVFLPTLKSKTTDKIASGIIKSVSKTGEIEQYEIALKNDLSFGPVFDSDGFYLGFISHKKSALNPLFISGNQIKKLIDTHHLFMIVAIHGGADWNYKAQDQNQRKFINWAKKNKVTTGDTIFDHLFKNDLALLSENDESRKAANDYAKTLYETFKKSVSTAETNVEIKKPSMIYLDCNMSLVINDEKKFHLNLNVDLKNLKVNGAPASITEDTIYWKNSDEHEYSVNRFTGIIQGNSVKNGARSPSVDGRCYAREERKF